MRHTTLLALLFVPGVTFAADFNGEDCDATQLAANGACVAPSASVAASVTTTADTFVGSSASVGPFVALGDVRISPRAVLVGWAAHATKPLTIGAGTTVGRNASIGEDHILGLDTTLSRAVTVGPRLTTGDDVFVGYAADLGSDVSLDDGAVVGNLVDLGNFTHLGPLAVIARNTTVADAASSAEGSDILGIVGPNTTIGSDVLIAATARVRKDVTLESGAQIMGGARVGRGAFVEAGSTVSGTVRAYGRVCAGDSIDAGETVGRGMTSQGTTSCVSQSGPSAAPPVEDIEATCLDPQPSNSDIFNFQNTLIYDAIGPSNLGVGSSEPTAYYQRFSLACQGYDVGFAMMCRHQGYPRDIFAPDTSSGWGAGVNMPWSSCGANQNFGWEIDFGRVAQGIWGWHMLTDQNATPFDFDAQTSSDGVTWQTVGTFTVPSGPSDQTYLLSSSVSAQYFRFVGRVGDLPAGSFTPAFMEPLF